MGGPPEPVLAVDGYGLSVDVPNNYLAKLMYYLDCMNQCLPYIQDGRLTDYRNAHLLTAEETQRVFLFCSILSPEVLVNQVLYLVYTPGMLDGCKNKFFENTEATRAYTMAAALKEVVFIQGNAVVIRKIMIFEDIWMREYYMDPLTEARSQEVSAPPYYPGPPINPYIPPTQPEVNGAVPAYYTMAPNPASQPGAYYTGNSYTGAQVYYVQPSDSAQYVMAGQPGTQQPQVVMLVQASPVPTAVVVQNPNRDLPCGIGMSWILFILGWCCIIAWLIGSFYMCSKDPREKRGGLANLAALIVFIIIMGILLGIN